MKIFKRAVTSLLVAIGLLVSSQPVSAGTDLIVSCSNIGTCAVSPSSTPLFEEMKWFPGSSTTQAIRMSNTSAQDGFSAIEVVNYRDEINDLGEIVTVAIHEGSPAGPVIYGGVSLHQFRDDGYFTFDALNAGESMDYYLTLSMPVTAGNKYQGSQVYFDLNLGLELEPLPPPSGGGDGEGGDTGGTTPASPPVCESEPPTEAPSLSVTNNAANTVSLSWSAVSPVTHYALVFTRNSDGESYGSTNIGNTTSYTVTNLSGGESYSFQIFGVNDCAPGDRSNTATTGTITGVVLAPDVRPLGPGGEVLGVDTEDEEEATSEDEIANEESAGELEGEVLGATTCVDWKFYVPWILLVVQAVLIALIDFILRDNRGLTKHIIAVLVTIASIILFYLLRSCNCYVEQSFLAWLCKWYWVVAVIVTLILRVFNYAFIENVEDSNEPKTPKPSVS